MDLREIALDRKEKLVIPYKKIEIKPGFNVRKDFGDTPGFAKDIAKNGQTHPVIVTIEDEHIYLVDGERRLRAITYAINVLHAPIEGVWCVKENKGSNEETRIVTMFSTGTNVKPLNPTEQASALKRLIDLGWTEKKIADQIGRTVTFVNDLLNLNGASLELRKAVETKQISKTAAMKLMKTSSAKSSELLGKSVGHKLRVKDVEKATKGSANLITAASIRAKIKIAEKNKSKDKPYWIAVQNGLEMALGTKEIKEIQ
jgi:ParB-like chromosome segregation protein Spo0J